MLDGFIVGRGPWELILFEGEATLPEPKDSIYNNRMKSKELQILGFMERRLDEICIKMLGELPLIKPLFPGMPRRTLPTCTITGKDRSLVKKEWDKYLKRLKAKRRMVKLADLERHYLCESDILGFITIRDPLTYRPAFLDIPYEIALKMIVLGYAPEI